MEFSFHRGMRGQDWFQWIRNGSFHRKRVNQCSEWSDVVRIRIPTGTETLVVVPLHRRLLPPNSATKVVIGGQADVHGPSDPRYIGRLGRDGGMWGHTFNLRYQLFAPHFPLVLVHVSQRKDTDSPKRRPVRHVTPYLLRCNAMLRIIDLICKIICFSNIKANVPM